MNQPQTISPELKQKLSVTFGYLLGIKAPAGVTSPLEEVLFGTQEQRIHAKLEGMAGLLESLPTGVARAIGQAAVKTARVHKGKETK